MAKEIRDRKRVVVEEVETPVSEEVVNSKDIEAKEESLPQTVEEDAHAEKEMVDEKMGEEIHKEEKHLHDIHTDSIPIEIPEKKSGNLVWWILIPGIFLLGALLGGIVFYQKGVNKAENEPTPTPLVSAVPSATPSSQIDLTKYEINILNGSGIAGEAGKVKSILEEAGFKVSGTGNASSYNFTKTVIKAKADVSSDFLAKLSETLGKTYILDKNQALSDSSNDEVQIIVGSSKAQ